MPDSFGWPTPVECLKKLEMIPDVALTPAMEAEVVRILPAVVAMFQSPVGQNDVGGGTGRTFTPYTATKIYDGTGMATMLVDDIVPNTTLTVSGYSTLFPDVILADPDFQGEGHNTLLRPNVVISAYPYTAPGRRLIFPRGFQNMTVTATWGFAATVPYDIWEAIRCEVVYRLLVGGPIGVNGVGQELEIDGMKISTAVGAMNWRSSSPVGVFHDTYDKCVTQYRRRPRYIGGRMTPKMYG